MSANCKCIQEVDAMLAERNTRLMLPLILRGDPTPRLMIVTQQIETGRGKKKAVGMPVKLLSWAGWHHHKPNLPNQAIQLGQGGREIRQGHPIDLEVAERVRGMWLVHTLDEPGKIPSPRGKADAFGKLKRLIKSVADRVPQMDWGTAQKDEGCFQSKLERNAYQEVDRCRHLAVEGIFAFLPSQSLGGQRVTSANQPKILGLPHA